MTLADNKDLFQTVFDSAPNGIAVMKPVYNDQGEVEDFSIFLFNAYTLKWIGDIDYKGKRYGDVFPMVKQTDVLQKFIEVFETGITETFERWYVVEGITYWFRFTPVKQDGLLVLTTEDITENKQSEMALQNALDAAEKQRRLYDSITNTTPDLVYVFDLDYNFAYANKALLTMWGKTAETAIGKGLRENGYEEWHAQMHEREIDAIVAGKKSIRGTVSFPHAELGSRVYDYILGPVFNEKGEVEAVAGTTRDITELKHTAENLQQSETRFRNMIEQSPVAILLSRGEQVIIESVNEPMLRFMNKTSADEVLGKKMIEALPELIGQPALQTVINVQKTGIPFQGDEQPVDLMIDGQLERRYFNFSYNLIKEAGENSAVLHMAVDVTEQVLSRRKIEESEARLKSMIDQTPAPTLVLMGDDLVIGQINQPMLQMIGRGEEVIGSPLIAILPELEGQYVWTQVRKVYEEGVAVDHWEVLVPHNRTGVTQDYYYNIAYRPLKENGVITGMIQVAIDVTEHVKVRKRLEESESHYKDLSESLEHQVSERTKELQRSNEDLQQFAHVASHDLKEPIRKIKTFTSRLEQQLADKLDEPAKRFIERIHVATERMFMMIDGVLDYSTINAGTQKIEPVNLNDVIKNIETDLEVTLQKTGGSIHYNNLPTVEGATVLLYQLFYNLINNSIKFAKAGVPPQITLTAALETGHNERQAMITLQDNGIGFDPAQATHIFETFTRLNSKDQYEGTGLGLSLCKKIAERHGGNITATGSLTEGAAFIITLPLQQKEPGI